MNSEIYKDIPGYPPYQVSNKGNVRNSKTLRVRKSAFEYTTSEDGIKKPLKVKVIIRLNKEPVYFSVHRLVGKLFLDAPNEDQATIDHKDRNPFNNDVDNLRWASSKEQAMNRNSKVKRKLSMDDIELMYNQSRTLTLDEMQTIHNIDRVTIHKLLSFMHPDY